MGHDARKHVFGFCEQQKCRAAWASAQSDQGLCYSLTGKLASSEISIFYLVSEAEENGMSRALTETPKTGFVAIRPIRSKIRLLL